MSQQFISNVANQENSGLGGAGRARGKAEFRTSVRPVLGEISQNLQHRRAQPARGAKQADKPFSIFCDDENAGVCKKVAPARAPLSTLPSLPAPALLRQVESFDSSSASMETDSPMVVDLEESLALPSLASAHTPAPDTADILAAPEYCKDIYDYLREAEVRVQPKYNYMSKQPDITGSMRAILVDWLVEVGEEYKLQTETLFLAVSYIDRFLSYMSVQRAKLQLVGAAAMFIASKYEEIYPPDVGEFVYITDDTYNKRQVLRMEHLVLKVLNFDLSAPTSLYFLSQLTQMSNTDEKTKHLAMYLCELSLMCAEFLRFRPSEVGAGSLALARLTTAQQPWPAALATETEMQLTGLHDCMVLLNREHSKAGTAAQQAVREKYKTIKYHRVADIPAASLV